MQIKLLRDSIIGTGHIIRPRNTAGGDAIQCGMVVKPKIEKAGKVVNLPESDANRLIALGSAEIPQQKAA